MYYVLTIYALSNESICQTYAYVLDVDDQLEIVEERVEPNGGVECDALWRVAHSDAQCSAHEPSSPPVRDERINAQFALKLRGQTAFALSLWFLYFPVPTPIAPVVHTMPGEVQWESENLVISEAEVPENVLGDQVEVELAYVLKALGTGTYK